MEKIEQREKFGVRDCNGVKVIQSKKRLREVREWGGSKVVGLVADI